VSATGPRARERDQSPPLDSQKAKLETRETSIAVGLLAIVPA